MENTLKISVFERIRVTSAVLAAAATIAFTPTDVMADNVDYSKLKRADNQPGWYTEHLDEDMAVITDWTDGDSGDGTSSQTTFDSKSCLKVETGLTPAVGDWGRRYRDVGTFGDRVVVEVSMYCDNVGAVADNDAAEVGALKGTVRFDAAFASDGLFVKNGSNVWTEVGTNLVVQDQWQDWRFEIDFSTPASATVDVYLGGVLQASGVDTARTGTWTEGLVSILQGGQTTASMVSYVDHIRVSDDLFINVNDTVTVTDAVVAGGPLIPGDWANKQKITIPSTEIDTDLVDFPLPIYISASSGTGGQDLSPVFDELTLDANRFKIAVTTSDGTTQCYVDIENWDDANEKAWLHVKVPSILAASDTVLYLYYDSTHSDNTAFVSDSGDAAAQNVWDENFEEVYHLSQDPSGGTGCIKDSTVHNRDGDTVGTMLTGDLVDGHFGKCLEFDGSDDGVEITGHSIQDETELTIEAVFNATSLPGVGVKDTIVKNSVGSNTVAMLQIDNNLLRFYAYITTTGAISVYSGTLSTATWYYGAGRWKTGESIDVILNAVETNGTVYSGSINRDGTDWDIAHWSNVAGRQFPGKVCEVRVSNVKRVDGWLKATRLGLSDSLLSFGADLTISVYDTVTVTESATASIEEAGGAALSINVFDTITVTESATALTANLVISVSDTITVTDDPAVSILDPGALGINVFDSVTVTESVSADVSQPSILYINVFDSITVTEAVSISVDNDLHVWRTDEVSGTGTEHLDEDMSVITDWTDNDNNNGVSSQETFLGEECLFLGGNVAGASNWASRTRDVGTFGDRVVIEVELYHEAIGTKTNDDQFRMIVATDDVRLLADFRLDGLYVNTGGVSYSEVGTNLVEVGEWQKWVFDCDFSDAATATADIYLDDTLVASDVDISSTGGFTDGYVELTQHAWTTDDLGTYVNYIKIHDDLLPGTINDTITVTESASVYVAPVNLDYQNWAKKLKIIVRASEIDEDLYDFPLPVYLSAASGIDNDDVSAVFDELTSDANRNKIAITALDCQEQYYVEIERWDDLNEKAWLHVRIPFISSTQDTELYLHYDSTHADNTDAVGDIGDAPAQNVWDSAFGLVSHMADDPSITTIKDSTRYANHGTANGGMTAGDLVDGQFGKCLDFDGLGYPNDDEIEFASGDQIKDMQQKTLEAIVDFAGPDGNFETFISKGGWRFEFESSGDLAYRHDASGNDGRWTVDFTTGSLQHVAASFDRSSNDNEPDIYVDGDIKTFVTDIQPTGLMEEDFNDVLTFGARAGIYPTAYAGKIDEVRISSVIRSAAWIKATYNGLFDGLLVFGDEQIFGETDIQDTITVTDAAEVVVHLAINVHDTITVTDAVVLSVEELNVFDTITVTEWVKIDTEGVFYATTMHLVLSTHSPTYYGYIEIDELSIRFSMGTTVYPLYGRMADPIITGSKPKVITEAFSAWIDIVNGGKPKVLCEGFKPYVEITGRDVKSRASGY